MIFFMSSSPHPPRPAPCRLLTTYMNGHGPDRHGAGAARKNIVGWAPQRSRRRRSCPSVTNDPKDANAGDCYSGLAMVSLKPSWSVTENPMGPHGRGAGSLSSEIPEAFACRASAVMS